MAGRGRNEMSFELREQYRKQDKCRNKRELVEFSFFLWLCDWEAVRLIVIAVNEKSSTCVEDKPHCSLSTRVVLRRLTSHLGVGGPREHTQCSKFD